MVVCCILCLFIRGEDVERLSLKSNTHLRQPSPPLLPWRPPRFSGSVMLHSGSFTALLGFSPRRLSKDDYCFLGHSPRETITANQAAPALKEPSGI